MTHISEFQRKEVIASQQRAGQYLVFKALLPGHNGGSMFFIAKSEYAARKRRDELQLVGGVKRATHAELLTIAVRALGQF